MVGGGVCRGASAPKATTRLSDCQTSGCHVPHGSACGLAALNIRVQRLGFRGRQAQPQFGAAPQEIACFAHPFVLPGPIDLEQLSERIDELNSQSLGEEMLIPSYDAPAIDQETTIGERVFNAYLAANAQIKVWKRYLQLGARAIFSGALGTILNPKPAQDFLDEDAVILVTGASRGLGAEYVTQLATQCKGKIILVARKAKAMEELVEQIKADNPDVDLAEMIVIPHDLGDSTENDPKLRSMEMVGAEESYTMQLVNEAFRTSATNYLSEEDVAAMQATFQEMLNASVRNRQASFQSNIGGKALAERLREEGLIPTVIINNAGISRNKPFHQTEGWERKLTNEVNFNQPLELMYELLPDMRDLDRRTKVIFVSSMAAFTGFPGNSSYGASRTAMRGFLRSVKHELREGDPEIYMIPFGQILTDASAEYQRWYMPAVTVEEAASDLIILTAAQNAPMINTPGTINQLTAFFDRTVSQAPADLIAASITGMLGDPEKKGSGGGH